MANKDNQQKFWKEVGKILPGGKGKNDAISLLNEDGEYMEKRVARQQTGHL